MFLLNTIATTDITKEIPLKYWIIFIRIMSFVLPLSYKILWKMFIPQNPEDDPPVWDMMGKKKK